MAGAHTGRATVATLMAQAVGLHRDGRLREAETVYRRIRSVAPRNTGALYNLALLLHQTGRTRECQRLLEEVVRIDPNDAGAHLTLGRLHRASGQATKALYHLRRAATLDTSSPDAALDLIATLGGERKLDEAHDAAAQAARRFPDSAGIPLQLGVALADAGCFQEARTHLERAVVLAPGAAPALYNLGKAADSLGDFAAALDLYRRAAAADPDFEPARFNLGELELRLGNTHRAVTIFDALLARQPDDPATISIRCQAAQFQPGLTAADLLTLHRRWQVQVGDRIRPVQDHRAAFLGPRAQPPARMRIGLVSSDLREHPVGHFVIRAMECLDPADTEIVAYSGTDTGDAIARRFRQRADRWRDTAGWSDEKLAAEIARDRIQVLFDLAGHTFPQRLLTFAARPAPIQLTWAGYTGTTGLAAIDGLLADRFEVPEHEDACYSERVIRLPGSYICYDPPADAPEVGPLPGAAAGHLTFGCFNNPSKVNQDIVTLWARVLADHPDARMRFVYGGYDLAEVQNRIRAWFAAGGVADERLSFTGQVPRRELLERYNGIDIALDTRPYSGGQTTLEALWMGVPVVTLPAPTFAGRHAASHLSVAGLPELVAADADDFTAIVRRLGNDIPGLAAMRAGLRQRVASSPLCDGPGFARNLRAVLQGLWDDWVAGRSGSAR